MIEINLQKLAVKVFYEELCRFYNQTTLAWHDRPCVDIDAIVKEFFFINDLVIVQFAKTNMINVKCKYDAENYDLLIGAQSVHVHYRGKYTTYHRANLPDTLVNVLDHILVVLKTNKIKPI